jgi:DNA-binding NarL/FixJ family response regulator
MNHPVKILLMDNQRVLADALGQLLISEDDLAIVGMARNGNSGVRIVRGGGRELLVLDVETTASDPIAEIVMAKASASDSSVLALSGASHADTIVNAGAFNHGTCLLTGASSRQVVDTIRDLLEDHDVLVSYTPSAPRFRRDPGVELLASWLSPRELDVLELIVAGYSNQRIAETYLLSLHTVRAHIHSILIKLGVHSKLEAAILAVQQRLVDFGDETVRPLSARAQTANAG